jgi:hypothetical protein
MYGQARPNNDGRLKYFSNLTSNGDLVSIKLDKSHNNEALDKIRIAAKESAKRFMTMAKELSKPGDSDPV